MRNISSMSVGPFLLARLESCVKHLGLGDVTCCLIAERNAIQISWPHATLTVRESIEIPVDSKWVDEVINVLRAGTPREHYGRLARLERIGKTNCAAG